MMDSAQKTVIEIALVSQRVVNILVRDSGHKTVESFQLDKIVVGSGAVLATLNKTMLLKDSTVDDRLGDWLSGEEPRICLGILNQMEALLSAKLDHGVKNFVQASRSTSINSKSDEAARLFQKRKDCFHFLLTTDIWNHEGSAQQQLRIASQSGARRIDEVVDNPNFLQVRQYKSGDASSVLHGRKIKRQKINTKKLNIVLEWLNALKCGETYERTLLLRQPDTCTWLPNMGAYKAWKNTENSFLWLHGKAGAGKSVLACVASVIEDLKSTLRSDEVLALFYCDFRNKRSTSATEVMRSLFSQLLQQFCHHTVNAGDLIEELSKEKDGATSMISNAVFLARYISRAAKLFSRQPFFVIDALDECNDVERLLDALIELSKGGVRLFVTSRPLLVITSRFSDLPSISMDAMKYAVSADITLHVTRELDSHRRLRTLDASLKNEIYTKLCKGADGMFRWVECQLNVLRRCVTAVRIREALDDLPTDLNATYERILFNVGENEYEGKVVRRALNWLVAALKPLRLSQVMEGLSINLKQRTLDRDSGPVHGFALLDVLGSLVTYNEATDIIILSHFSVKEYLVGEASCTKQPMYHINQQNAHEQLVLLCMCYVGIYLEELGGRQASHHNAHWSRVPRTTRDTVVFHPTIRPQPPSEFHPLLEYVTFLGLHHLAHVDPKRKVVLRAIATLQSNAQQQPSEWEQFCEKFPYYCIWPTREHDTMLYILIAFAPEPLLGSFIGRSQLKPKDGTNPLIYAALFRKIKHAKTLLSKGVSVNCCGWHVRGHHQVLPIQAAVDFVYRDSDIVDLFLTKGSSVPNELFVRIFQKHCDIPARIVSRLLQTDEFVEWAKARDQRLLLYSLDFTRYSNGGPSEREVDAIRRRLNQIGCDPPNQFNETSLRQAVSAGHVSTAKDILSQNVSLPPDIILDASYCRHSNTEMICLLLRMGCNINVTSSTGDTPLHLVMTGSLSEDECLESIQALINAGCNISACNLVGETPLHFAVAYGYISIVEYFLSLHIPLPFDILLKRPVRLKAAMVRLLTHKEVGVHEIAASGDTPLHLILGSPWPESGADEYQECVQILVDAGCNPSSSNALGETPLDVAAKMGCIPVMEYLLSLNLPLSPHILLSMAGWNRSEATPLVKLLIDKGADVHATQPNGDTLLHLSIDSGTSETDCLRRIQILVGAGCNLYARNLAGETPFHIAAQWKYVSVMEYLLSLGITVPSDIMLTQFKWLRSYNPSTSCSIVRFLCEKGGNIQTVAENGDNLLHSLARVSEEHGALDLAKFLVRAGCNPRTLNLAHETPLHTAARSGHVSVVNYLLSLDIPLPPEILLAATSRPWRQKPQMIRCLINKGAKISAVTNNGDTPLHLLLAGKGEEYNQLECVRILVDAGCDPLSRNQAGKTPLHAAASYGLIVILEHFISQGVSLPHDILLTSAPKTICFLLGKHTESVSINCDTELMHRAFDFESSDEDCLECARILIDAGCDPSFRTVSGETPMHVAARQGRISVIKYLLSQNVTLPTDILLAAVQGDSCWITWVRMPLLRMLIGEGASVNATTPSGNTPLHLSIRHDLTAEGVSWELIKVLLECGSDPYVRNARGETPFDLAKAKGDLFRDNFLRLVRSPCLQHSRS